MDSCEKISQSSDTSMRSNTPSNYDEDEDEFSQAEDPIDTQAMEEIQQNATAFLQELATCKEDEDFAKAMEKKPK